jgi:hypothetical protein
MDDLLLKARACSERARRVVRELRIVEHWEDVGARVHVVGSLRTGLQIRHLDIDFHVYSNPLQVAASFQAVGSIANHPRVHSVSYRNLLDAEDQCLEWHALYTSEAGEEWQIDMIHMHPESPYAGVFEDVADRIAGALTDETRTAILAIKDAVPAGQKVPGIRIYQAVLRDGVRGWNEFATWDARHPDEGIVTWAP